MNICIKYIIYEYMKKIYIYERWRKSGETRTIVHYW